MVTQLCGYNVSYAYICVFKFVCDKSVCILTYMISNFLGNNAIPILEENVNRCRVSILIYIIPLKGYLSDYIAL